MTPQPYLVTTSGGPFRSVAADAMDTTEPTGDGGATTDTGSTACTMCNAGGGILPLDELGVGRNTGGGGTTLAAGTSSGAP